MPTCQNFLQGICLDENCKFSHVRVNSNAAICPNFEKGYCGLGKKCKLKHIRPGKAQKQKQKRKKHKKDKTGPSGDTSSSDSSDSESEDENKKRNKKRKKNKS